LGMSKDLKHLIQKKGDGAAGCADTGRWDGAERKGRGPTAFSRWREDHRQSEGLSGEHGKKAFGA